MSATLETQTLAKAVHLACRAPSAHNSQPWQWVAEGQPQVLIRAGMAPPLEAVSPPTPRRPPGDVLRIL
jgi:hypothetical protein